MGRMETGKDGISDPAMANAVQGLWGFRTKHPKVDSKLRYYVKYVIIQAM